MNRDDIFITGGVIEKTTAIAATIVATILTIWLVRNGLTGLLNVCK